MKRFIFAVSVAVISLTTWNSTFAATDTATLAVSATVINKCNITIPTNLTFGNYDAIANPAGNNVTFQGGVGIACTKGIPSGATFFIGIGTTANAPCPPTTPATSRCMSGAGDKLSYEIYLPPTNAYPSPDCTYTSPAVWQNAAGSGLQPTSPPTLAMRTYNICGRIPGGQDVNVGAYSDTITATVNF